MSEYDDLMNLSDAKLAEGDSLLQVSESYKRSAEATLAKGHELRKQAEDIKAEEAKAKELEFIPGEWVEVYGHLATYVGPSDDKTLPHAVCWTGGRDGWGRCSLPEGVPGIFTRHVGDECPVSDKGAEVIILTENGRIHSGSAIGFDWRKKEKVSPGDIISYVIIPKWALERVK